MKELNLARGEHAALSAANTALEDRVTRTVVRALVPGVVKQVKVNTVGGVIQPGMDLVEIIPLEDTLLIEARVRPSDIAFLRPGQEAMVKLSAYDFSIYGGFPAALEHISADTLTPERPGEKVETYYQIRVRTKQSRPSGHPEILPILPGMVATVDIKTGKKTILHYLLKPIIKTKEAAIDRHTMPVETVRLDRTKRLVARVWRAIEAEHFYPAPSPMACGGCPFRELCRKGPG